MELDEVELWRLEVSAHCGCGEPLSRGMQAGFDPTARELLCLRCLEDLRAGRPRTRSASAVPSTDHSASETSTSETSTSAGGPTSAETPTSVETPPGAEAAPHSVGDNETDYGVVGYSVTRPPRRGGSSTATKVLVALLLAALAVVGIPRLLPGSAGADAFGKGRGSSLGDIAMGSPITPVAPPDSDGAAPPVPSDAGKSRLRPSPRQRSTSTAYTFLATTTSGRPVGFDPCRPIHLVVNGAESPRGGDQLIREAAAQVSAATGLVITVDGRTSETPTIRRRSVDVRLYGNRWAPVLVAWTHDSANSELAGRVVGVGGPVMAPYRDRADLHYVTGAVLLDAPAFEQILDEPGGRVGARSIVMHELGHLVGLGHVTDRRQLMYSSMEGQTGFGAGDLEGLRLVGSGPCFSG